MLLMLLTAVQKLTSLNTLSFEIATPFAGESPLESSVEEPLLRPPIWRVVGRVAVGLRVRGREFVD